MSYREHLRQMLYEVQARLRRKGRAIPGSSPNIIYDLAGAPPALNAHSGSLIDPAVPEITTAAPLLHHSLGHDRS